MARKKNIVTIGGGTGSFTLLNGLKKFNINLSAVVSMADDGGSTGVLRDELGVLPPGDVRQCLVALSDSEKSFRDLLTYRFEEGKLKGHNFGNLFLSALSKIEGSFVAGLKEAMNILSVQGKVLPVTEEKANLRIELNGGKILEGENKINHSNLQKNRIKKIYYQPKIKGNIEAIEEIRRADVIIIGPGNHYCSILPNLIIPEIGRTIQKSKAKVVYNCNLTNKKGHTEGFDLDDYVQDINRHIGENRIDHVIFNGKKPNVELVRKYEKQEGKDILIKFDPKKNKQRKYKIVKGDILSNQRLVYSKADKLSSKRAFIRHDSDKLAKLIMLVSEIEKYKNIINEIV